MLMICGSDNFAGEKVFEYFRRGDEEIWLLAKASFKIVLENFEEAMWKFGSDKF